MIIDLPEIALVTLVGISGSGKSTFARRHFGPGVLSSDTFRALVADDENDQSASGDAFDALHYVAGKRLRAGRLTVVDATNVQQHARAALIKLAREHDVLPVAIVLNTPEQVCWERTEARADRDFGRQVLQRQSRDLRRSLRHLSREGFRKVHVVDDPDQVEIAYSRLFNNRRELAGPFDIVGDVHGCRAELELLLAELGWQLVHDDAGRPVDAVHPAGRTAVFVGDLVDRGPDAPGVLRLVMGMIAAGHALCVAGNHEAKLLRHLRGRQVKLTHGLAETVAQLAADPIDGLGPFLDGLISHYVLDGGRLVVAHAGLKEAYHGRASGRVRAFAMYGDTTGETDEYGLPVRYPWADEYRGAATVVYGHTPTVTPEWINNTICLDTGCVFGGRLTALRYPERRLVAVDALAEHYPPARPLGAGHATATRSAGVPGAAVPAGVPGAVPGGPAASVPPGGAGDALPIADVLGRRHLETRYGRVLVPAEHAAAALEVMSRYAVDPRWLRWLPPTMAPASTSSVDGYLEHPREALADLHAIGVERVVCEEKHMGSRAVVLACRDRAAAERHFAADGVTGAIYTRTGRPFFDRDRTERLLAEVRVAIEAAGLWRELDTEWLLLDCELLPWSAKALPLIQQFAGVAAAGEAALPAVLDVLGAAANRGLDVGADRRRWSAELDGVRRYADAYRRYIAPTEDLDGVSLAPFAVLAGAGMSYAGRDHLWQLDVADRLVAAAPHRFTATRRLDLELSDLDAAVAKAADWWTALTEAGGEGMVVKPYAGLAAVGRDGRLAQPGIKCRGREYLRIIYGPAYTEPERLARLRQRRLGRKRALALREHGLGLAALEAAAGGAPLYRNHQLVFAILAAESEPVDPRL